MVIRSWRVCDIFEVVAAVGISNGTQQSTIFVDGLFYSPLLVTPSLLAYTRISM